MRDLGLLAASDIATGRNKFSFSAEKRKDSRVRPPLAGQTDRWACQLLFAGCNLDCSQHYLMTQAQTVFWSHPHVAESSLEDEQRTPRHSLLFHHKCENAQQSNCSLLTYNFSFTSVFESQCGEKRLLASFSTFHWGYKRFCQIHPWLTYERKPLSVITDVFGKTFCNLSGTWRNWQAAFSLRTVIRTLR